GQDEVSTVNISRSGVGAWIIVVGVLAALPFFWFTNSLQLGGGVAGGACILYLLGRVGLLTHAEFRLQARCTSAVRVGEVLDAVARTSLMAVESVQWRYDSAPTSRAELIARCIARAHDRAATLAQQLRVKLLSVHSYFEAHQSPNQSGHYSGYP